MAKRLKKTDFPDDRRYSRERIWVMPSAGGNFWLGVSMNAISLDSEKQTAYFVDVQRQGSLVQGKPFGFIDVETGRFELLAPISGRVLRWNKTLAEDPALVSNDPFGAGWLCEVAREGEGLFERLFERDAFYALLNFEMEARRLGLEPTIHASYLLEDGAAWPRDFSLAFGGKQICRSRIVKLGRNETFTPQWATGDKWKVRCEVEQPSIAMVAEEFAHPRMVERFWEFEVLDDQGDVGGVDCYVVKAIEVQGVAPHTFYRLSIAKADFTLRLIEEESVFDASRRSRTPNDWGAEGFIELRALRDLIVDLPLFPADNRYEKRMVTVGTEPPYMQETRFPDERTMAIAVDAPLRDKKLRCEQVWKKGLPWWKTAKRVVDDVVLISGELVS